MCKQSERFLPTLSTDTSCAHFSIHFASELCPSIWTGFINGRLDPVCIELSKSNESNKDKAKDTEIYRINIQYYGLVKF